VELTNDLSTGKKPSSASPASDEIRQADVLLERAISRLERLHSIAAEFSYRVDLFGKQLGGKGDYWEERSGPTPRVRMELKMPLGDKMGALVQVCDGRYLWTYRRLLDHGKLTQVDLQRVTAELDQPGQEAAMKPPLGSIGMGGMAGLLVELRRNFDFEVVGRTDLLGRPTWTLHGGWLPERLVTLLPDQKGVILRGGEVDYTKLAAHLPSHVTLMLGTRDLFPYRVEYRRSGRRQSSSLGNKPPTAGKAVVTMQLGPKIHVNGPIDPARFDYRPGNVEPSDATESLIKRLQARAKSAKTEAKR